MRFEVPECRRCCSCVPLRHGVIVFGYLNLAFNLFVLTVESMRLSRRGLAGLTLETIYLYKGVAIRTEMWLTATLYVLDVIFIVVLLIGAHMKRASLIRTYYYFGITTTLAIFVCFLFACFHSKYELDFTAICLIISGLVLQIYLLILIRSELTKGRYSDGCISYYNQTSEVAVYPTAWTDRA